MEERRKLQERKQAELKAKEELAKQRAQEAKQQQQKEAEEQMAKVKQRRMEGEERKRKLQLVKSGELKRNIRPGPDQKTSLSSLQSATSHPHLPVLGKPKVTTRPSTAKIQPPIRQEYSKITQSTKIRTETPVRPINLRPGLVNAPKKQLRPIDDCLLLDEKKDASKVEEVIEIQE